MKARAVIARALAELPGELAELVGARVRIVVRAHPTPADRGLGIGADWRGAFVGVQYEGDAAACGGAVFLYTDHIRSEAELEEVLLHELDHFVGADEDDVEADGMGEHLGLAEAQPL